MVIDYILYLLVLITAYICIVKTIDLISMYSSKKDKSKSLMTNWVESLSSNEIDHLLFKKTALLGILATIVATAPFIGLSGTVYHIIQALKQMNGSVTDISVISGPISTALYSTLWGLASAIPSLIYYNGYVRYLEQLKEEKTILLKE